MMNEPNEPDERYDEDGFDEKRYEEERSEEESAEEKRDEAAELYARGRELEARGDYGGARRCLERSLALREDDAVRAAYLKVMSAIGPE